MGIIVHYRGGILLNKGKNLYTDNGIELSIQSLYAGERFTLTYSGILARSGADRIFAHYGYGEAWEEQEYTEMAHCDGTFIMEFDPKASGTLQVCFKDSADNWDNNSNENYSFKVLVKKSTRKSKKAILAG